MILWASENGKVEERSEGLGWGSFIVSYGGESRVVGFAVRNRENALQFLPAVMAGLRSQIGKTSKAEALADRLALAAQEKTVAKTEIAPVKAAKREKA